jgi:hypothetical protein
MKNFRVMAALFVLFTLSAAITAAAQQVDVAFGVGTLSAPGVSTRNGLLFPSETGGTYISFSGDVLIHKRFGVGAEVAWRASQNSYAQLAPYRPIFYDFNGIWAPQLTKRLTAELEAGIGGEDIRFYTGYGAGGCDIYGYCNNYVSSNHFMGDFGGGIRAYVWHNLFIRPEARLYLIHNNAEFSSGHAVRYGASIGYSFGR